MTEVNSEATELTLNLNVTHNAAGQSIPQVTSATISVRLFLTALEKQVESIWLDPSLLESLPVNDFKLGQPIHEELSLSPSSLREIDSSSLLQGEKEILIRHGDEVYRLRLTKNGKLILQK